MSNNKKKILTISTLAAIMLLSLLLLAFQGGLGFDQYFVIAALAMLMLGRGKEFVWDWLPIIVLFIFYRFLRSLAPILNPNVNIYPMIEADLFLFGHLPTITMQDLFYSHGSLQWYDFFATGIYVSHYFIYFAALTFFWFQNKNLFYRFSSAFLLLSYLAFLTYIIFPAMPPWLASDLNHIPKVYKIMSEVFASFPRPVNLLSLYDFLGANLVAAVPSMHAAYPLLLVLYLPKQKVVQGLGLLYLFLVWIAIIYLGEHYVVDIIAMLPYVALSYYLVEKPRKRSTLKN